MAPERVAGEQRNGVIPAQVPSDEGVAASDVILDVRVVVAPGFFRDALPCACENGNPVPFPAALRVDSVPAARFGQRAAVRLVHESDIEQLPAVSLVRGTERQDRLRLVVRLAARPPNARRVHLPMRLLRIGEPEAGAAPAQEVSAEITARNQLPL